MNAAEQPEILTEPQALRAERRSLLVETLVVAGAALAAWAWVIPAQTTPSPDAAGLAPATLPSLCALAIAALALLRLLLAFVGGNGRGRRSTAHAHAHADGDGDGDGDTGARPGAVPGAVPDADSPVRIGPLPAVLVMMAIALAGVLALRWGGPLAGVAVLVLPTTLALGERRPGRIALVLAIALLPTALLR